MYIHIYIYICICIYIYIYIYIYTIDGNMYNLPLDLGSKSQRQMHSERVVW